jgi:hypothetical protein
MVVRTIFSGAWWIGRVTALTVGLAVMLALVVGVASAHWGGADAPVESYGRLVPVQN